MNIQHNKRQLFLNILFTVICIAVIVPFFLVVSISLSNEGDISNFGYSFFPRNIDFSAYNYILKNPKMILNGYKVTTIFSVLSTFLGVLLMSMLAYTLSKRGLKGRNKLSFFVYFTMLFNGGLVPTYILITQYLHLDDSIWVYILPGLISPWYVFMIRTFFQGIPQEIAESAYIDGGSEYIIFFKMILPLSKPVLATVALFIFLLKWNDWYTSMLYINKEELISLQYLLQRIMQNIAIMRENTMSSALMTNMDIPTETVRMAMAVVVAGPALIIFPFFQKYFVKGLTVGAVKG